MLLKPDKRQIKITTGKDPSVKEICKEIAIKIIDIYESASIPVVTPKQIRDLLFSYHGKYQNLMKSYKSYNIVKSYDLRMLRQWKK